MANQNGVCNFAETQQVANTNRFVLVVIRIWHWMRKTIWNDFWTALRARFKKPATEIRAPEFKPFRVRSNIRYNRLYIGKRGYRYRLPKMKQVGNFRVPLPC